MSFLPFEGSSASTHRAPLPVSELDAILTAHMLVAWAGEHGEGERPTRLGWWRTDLISEFGGFDLFRRLTPSTWEWTAWRAVREAARRCDSLLVRNDHDPDRLCTLFRLGFETDERIGERFEEWVASHGTANFKSTPVGIEVEGDAAALHPGEFLVARRVALRPADVDPDTVDDSSDELEEASVTADGDEP